MQVHCAENRAISVERPIKDYNELRPHASLGYLTPENIHRGREIRALKWYLYKKVRYAGRPEPKSPIFR
ncbi:integrase core domain-containing protein [Persicitalea jodogahamensis]|uniref:Integrase catalytic domain-containing protein n=1 Tax=Persicitalea jodogahamensis TaxID=402147 RepID=A0A8J3D865_9BACT|nr:integrase core domain-containing protein [Persicitalea jodogahamensis]GHB86594.1 hypothetical protein GCM10007390_47760 [Persicitalea jodogahamensis]